MNYKIIKEKYHDEQDDPKQEYIRIVSKRPETQNGKTE